MKVEENDILGDKHFVPSGFNQASAILNKMFDKKTQTELQLRCKIRCVNETWKRTTFFGL